MSRSRMHTTLHSLSTNTQALLPYKTLRTRLLGLRRHGRLQRVSAIAAAAHGLRQHRVLHIRHHRNQHTTAISIPLGPLKKVLITVSSLSRPSTRFNSRPMLLHTPRENLLVYRTTKTNILTLTFLMPKHLASPVLVIGRR